MNKKFLCIVMLCVVVVASCKNRNEKAVVAKSVSTEAPGAGAMKMKGFEPPAPGADDMELTLEDGDAIALHNNAQPAPVAIPQKVIHTANIVFSVEAYDTSKKNIHQSVRGLGGYIANENETSSDYERRSILQIKVPTDKFDATLAALSGQAKRLDQKNISAEDVTRQYVDTDARLRARKAVEARYLDILQKANKVTDILEVEEKLNAIREEIESAQGQLQYMDHQVAMSTINLTFYETIAGRPTPGFFSNLGASLRTGWNNVLEVALDMIAAWPAWLLVIAVFFVGRRIYKRLKKDKTVTA